MASTLLDTDAVRELVESGLDNAALEVYIDAADEDIINHAGPHGTDVVYSRTASIRHTNRLVVHLPRPAVSITSITIDNAPVTDDSYTLTSGGRTIEFHQGAYWYWSGVVNPSTYLYPPIDVVVTYTAVSDTGRRKRALVDLVKLGLQFDGLQSERVGSYSRMSSRYGTERNRILTALGGRWTLSE